LKRDPEGVRWRFEDDRIRLQYEMSTYQSWNCASGSPSFGCMVTYKMPGVALDAIAKANCDDQSQKFRYFANNTISDLSQRPRWFQWKEMYSCDPLQRADGRDAGRTLAGPR
jgi:hypothetical protein